MMRPSRMVNLPGKMTNRPTNQTSEPLEIGLAGIRIPAMTDKSREQAGDERKKTTETLPLLGLSSEREFQELRISALLKDRCYVTEKGLVRIQLELSGHPPLGWSYIFLNVWQKSEDPKKARAELKRTRSGSSAMRRTSRSAIFRPLKRPSRKRTRVFAACCRSKLPPRRDASNWIAKRWKRSWDWTST